MSTPSYGQTGSALPVCPRHPDRVSYVRCQRCGRPTCPQCQRQAPVGVQCVDCVAEAERAIPAQRTIFGGRVREGRPLVATTIIALCAVAYLLLSLTGFRSVLLFAPVLGAQEPYRFISAAFMHAGFLHLAVNMYALWIVGSVLEPAFGRWRFTVLYLLSALGGSVGVLLLASPQDNSWFVPVVGASGAVFGLFGAIAVVLRRTGRDMTQILVLIAINAILGFTIPNIAWEAHLGGLLTGAVLAAAYAYAPKSRQGMLSVAASVVVLALLVIATLAKYASVG